VTRVLVHTDGGSRGNPGEAAIGVVVEEETEGGRVLVAEVAEKIGVTTNNVAEYRALIRGLEEARRLEAREVSCLLDSQLVVEQMNGRYKVKHANVVDLHRRALDLGRGFDRVTYAYIPRAQNAEADRLVNAALDGTPVARAAAAGAAGSEGTDGAASMAVLPAGLGGAALAAVTRAFRDAVEIPRASVEELNRRLPEGLRYRDEADLWRERWAAAVAVGRFAVQIGVLTPHQLDVLETEFRALRPF
jgi:ribonuclease HI